MDKALRTYLDEIDKVFSSSKHGDLHYFRIVIGGLGIRLCFTGERLSSSIMPAFEHLIDKEDKTHTGFTINFWDDLSFGPGFPDNPWAGEMAKASDRLLMFNQGHIHMLYNPDSRVFSLVDTDEKKAYYHAPDLRLIPYYEKSSPMRMILHWIMEGSGYHLVHAASAGIADKAILLAGKGTSGKSTTSLACLAYGMDYLGDDYVAVRRDPEPEVFSIYSTVEVNDDMLGKLPGLAEYVENPARDGLEKAMIFLDRHYGRNIVRRSGIEAIVMPVVTGNPISRIYSIPPIRAFAELASSTIFQMPGSSRDMLSGLRKTLEDIPVFAIDLGSELEEVTDTLKGFIKSL